MSTYKMFFEEGLSQPYRFVSEREALMEACNTIAVFVDPYSQDFVRQMALGIAGKYMGAIHDPFLVNTLNSIFYRCFNLREGEALALSQNDKSFIKTAIHGGFHKAFYE